jgi:hypothetical protein
MIPFVPTASKKIKPKAGATAVTALDADGKPLGTLEKEALSAKTIVIDRGGFGVRIELDQPRKVQRGENNTVLIHLTEGPTTASKVGVKYRLVPFGTE